MAAVLNSAILDLSILHKKTSFIHCDLTWWWQPSWILQSCVQPFCTKKNLTHSFWINLMMAAILNSAMLDSDIAILDSNTLLSSLRFTQKHSFSILTLTQTNSVWLNLMNSAMLDSDTLLSFLRFTQKHSPSTLTLTLTQTNAIWLIRWWQPSWILPTWIPPSWIQPS